jgi:hypothetical protein
MNDTTEPDHRSVGVLGKIEHKAKKFAQETEEEIREVRHVKLYRGNFLNDAKFG